MYLAFLLLIYFETYITIIFLPQASAPTLSTTASWPSPWCGSAPRARSPRRTWSGGSPSGREEGRKGHHQGRPGRRQLRHVLRKPSHYLSTHDNRLLPFKRRSTAPKSPKLWPSSLPILIKAIAAGSPVVVDLEVSLEPGSLAPVLVEIKNVDANKKFPYDMCLGGVWFRGRNYPCFSPVQVESNFSSSGSNSNRNDSAVYNLGLVCNTFVDSRDEENKVTIRVAMRPTDDGSLKIKETFSMEGFATVGSHHKKIDTVKFTIAREPEQVETNVSGQKEARIPCFYCRDVRISESERVREAGQPRPHPHPHPPAPLDPFQHHNPHRRRRQGRSRVQGPPQGQQGRAHGARHATRLRGRQHPLPHALPAAQGALQPHRTHHAERRHQGLHRTLHKLR
ncbi:uncharacterized protein CEXT_438691 [Caerostris extrusa]|uniref:Uncharacterized protein n=1 Tax=Caerostris extrusa TaxID=172846 RepID=A0AAV4X2N1_CAEEX|nr:uncharacterized protein CEXT_438691 [Caerostris extrusa]